MESLEVEDEAGRVEVLASVVHPDVGDSHQIALYRVLLGAFRAVELVGRLFEHVADPRAGHCRHLHSASTLTN